MMKRVCMMMLTALLLTAGLAHADLHGYLDELSVSAHADLDDFAAQLGARFDLANGQVELVLSSVDSPADAAMVLWLGEKSRQPREKVLQVYHEQKGQGWGALAKSLGIKPGSAAFHSLRKGELDFHPAKHDDSKADKGKQHGKEHAKGKGNKK